MRDARVFLLFFFWILLTAFILEYSTSGECYANQQAIHEHSRQDMIKDVKSCMKPSITGRGYPWYDAKKDSIKPFKFEEEKKAETTPVRSYTNVLSLSTFIRAVMYVVMIGLILVIIIYLVILYHSHRERFLHQESTKYDEKRRTEALPEQVRHIQGNFLSLSHEAYVAGDLRLAVIYLYSYALLEMDTRRYIHLERGRTNREYLRQLRHDQKKRSLFAGLVYLFEETFFGEHTPSELQLKAAYQDVDDILTSASDKSSVEESPFSVTTSAGLCLMITLSLVSVGCYGKPDFTYGVRDSFSVQGTAILADILEKRGHRVHESSVIYDKDLEKHDCIFWFIDDNVPPAKKAVSILDKWLVGGGKEGKKPRTLIVVGRDFNADELFLSRSLHMDLDNYTREETKKLNKLVSDSFWTQRPNTTQKCRWYKYDYYPMTSCKKKWSRYYGLGTWTSGLSTENAEIDVYGSLSFCSPQELVDNHSEKKEDPLQDIPDKDHSVNVPEDDEFRLDVKEDNLDAEEDNIEEEEDTVENTAAVSEYSEEEKKDTASDEDMEPDLYTEFYQQRETLLGLEYAAGDTITQAPLILRSRFYSLPEKRTASADTSSVYPSEDSLDVTSFTAQRFIIANGCFLLNAQMINDDCRVLAVRLVDELQGTRQKILFLEGGGDIYIINNAEDKAVEDVGVWHIFTREPSCWIAYHLVILFIIYGFFRWPIFGRPIHVQEAPVVGFGKHIRAVARLLRRSK